MPDPVNPEVPSEVVEQTQENQENLESQENQATSEVLNLDFILPNGVRLSLPLHPKDGFQDVRQFIVELPEAYFFTCFHFSFNGKKIDDFVEIGAVEGLGNKSEIHLVESLYNEREAKLHIKRLQSFLDAANSDSGNLTGTSVYPFVGKDLPQGKEVKGAEALEGSGILDEVKLSNYYPTEFPSKAPKCLKNLSFSAWNPAPRARQLQGDLYYLQVDTLDNKEYHITSSVVGFFVNGSTRTKFDPTPSSNHYSHSLFGLLSTLDASFQTHFAALQDYISGRSPFESVPASTLSVPWCVPASYPHGPSQARLESFLAGKLEVPDFPGQVRDWNEEFQSCRELPKRNVQERVLRDRALFKISSDFLEAAKLGAVSVVEGNVPALNPSESESSRMYLYHNIFFSFASDARDTFKKLGGDPAAHAAAGKDLHGAIAFNTLDLGVLNEETGLSSGGLHTPLTAIIDFKGFRLVAQSIIPNILRRDQNTAVQYGGIDNGKEIRANPEFHAIMEKAAEALHLAKHTLVDEKENTVEIFGSADFKGLTGGDERRYIIDLYRTTPVDANFVPTAADQPAKLGPYLHQMTFLRFELIAQFFEFKYLNFLKEKVAEKQAEQKKNKEEKQSEEAEKSKEKEKEKEEEPKTNGAEAEAEDPQLSFGDDELKFSLTLNSDTFTSFKSGDSEDKLKQDQKLVTEAADYLLNSVIPSLITDFLTFQTTPMDSKSLTETLHSRGINMRYLGKIVQLMDDAEKQNASGVASRRFEYIKNLIIQEMILRATKHIFREYIRPTPTFFVASRVATFLNAFLGENNAPPTELPATAKVVKHAKTSPVPAPAPKAAAEGASKSKKKKSSATKKAKAAEEAKPKSAALPVATNLSLNSIFDSLPTLTHDHLWSSIIKEIKSRFLFDLPFQGGSKALFEKLTKLPVLRNFVLKVGIQVAARDYDFSAKGATFHAADITSFHPVTKSLNPTAYDARELLDAGKTQYTQGKPSVAIELFSEALAVFQQVYGLIHPDIVSCLSSLSLALYQIGDIEQAVVHQERAVLISERVYGLDDPETARLYTNLALLLFAQEKTALALRFMSRARLLAQVTYGANHPESITSESNISLMLQQLKDFDLSLNVLKGVTNLQEKLFGTDHFITANSYHLLAKTSGLVGKFKDGVNYERLAYSVFSKKFGTDDPRTKESSEWLMQLTQNAVITERSRRELQWNQGISAISTESAEKSNPRPKTKGKKRN